MIELKFPMALDGYGRFVSHTSYEDIYKQRVLAVVSTMQGTRAMRPEFGSGVEKQLFANGPEVVSRASSQVTAALMRSLPEVRVEEASGTFDEDSGVVTLDIRFSLPNNKQSSTMVTINQDQLSPYVALNIAGGME
jgi:phage baseplate assembly protein W